MTKILYRSIVAVALVSAAAPALAVESQTMTRDGITYVYSVSETAKGTQIRGREQGGRPFSLLVANGRVTGVSNDHPVSFRLTDVVKTSAVATEISSR